MAQTLCDSYVTISNCVADVCSLPAGHEGRCKGKGGGEWDRMPEHRYVLPTCLYCKTVIDTGNRVCPERGDRTLCAFDGRTLGISVF